MLKLSPRRTSIRFFMVSSALFIRHNVRSLCVALLLPWLFVGLQAQTASFGSVNVGSSTTATVDITILSAGTLGSIQVLTQGTAGLDFTNAGGGTCATGTAYAANATCTVNVTYTPKFAGIRYGGVLLDDGSGNVLATSYVYGTGTGPQVAFTPGIQSTIGSGWIQPWAVALDGAGNLYVANYPTAPYASGGSLVKLTLTGGSYTRSTIGSGIIGPTGVAVDGAGNVYIADSSAEVVFKETPTTGGYIQSEIPTPGMSWPIGVAVDGSGNVYVTDAPNNRILKETLSGGSYIQSVIGTGLNYPMGIAVDGNGTIYVTDEDSRLAEEKPSGNGYIESIIFSTVLPGAIGNGQSVAVDGSHNLFIAQTTTYQVVKLPWTGNAYGPPVTLSALTGPWDGNSPWGVAVDGSGNVYFTSSSGNLYKLDYADAPSLTFATPTPVGSTDTADGAQTVTVQNIGNVTLAFQPFATGNLLDAVLTSSGPTDCTALSNLQLVSGTACTLGVEFAPARSGQSVTGYVNVLDNALNAASTQTISVLGTGSQGTQTITFTNPGTQTYGTPLMLTATASSGLPITYTVTGPATVSGSILTFTGVGSVTVQANQAGNANYFAATPGSVTFMVNKEATTVTLSPANSVTLGASTTLTATVSPATATGSVTFKNGSTTLGTGTLSGGTATLTLAATTANGFAVGSDSITAVYAGDSDDAGSTSSVATLTVTESTSTTVTVSPSSIALGSSSATQSLTATVTTTSGTPMGTVTFKVGTVTVGSAAYSGGSATLNGIAPTTANGFTVGSDTVTVSYTPTTGTSFVASSGTQTLTVTAPAYTITPSPTTVSLSKGGSQSVTVTLASTTFADITTWTVTTSSPLITVSPSSGTATLSANSSSTASLTITASSSATNHAPRLPWTGGLIAFGAVLGVPLARRRKRLVAVLLTALAITTLGFLMSCGGGGGSSTPTSPRSYTVTISGTGGISSTIAVTVQ